MAELTPVLSTGDPVKALRSAGEVDKKPNINNELYIDPETEPFAAALAGRLPPAGADPETVAGPEPVFPAGGQKPAAAGNVLPPPGLAASPIAPEGMTSGGKTAATEPATAGPLLFMATKHPAASKPDAPASPRPVGTVTAAGPAPAPAETLLPGLHGEAVPGSYNMRSEPGAASASVPGGLGASPSMERLELFSQIIQSRRTGVQAHPLADTGSAAPPLSAAPQGPAAPPPAATTFPAYTIATSLQQPGWDQGFAQRVHWLIGQQIQSAELQLDPPELGPIGVRIALDHDRASVTFVTQHGVVRDAVEASLPRLREMLNNEGITLADVSVEQRGPQQHDGDSGARGTSLPAYAGDAGAVPDTERQSPHLRVSTDIGLVDLYA